MWIERVHTLQSNLHDCENQGKTAIEKFEVFMR